MTDVPSLSGYDAVKAFAGEKPEWLSVVRACYRLAERSDEFAGSWVLKELGSWVSSLRPLARLHILEKTGSARGGHRAYYRMPDRDGVGRALSELEAAASPTAA